jgi:hypothetical protein
MQIAQQHGTDDGVRGPQHHNQQMITVERDGDRSDASTTGAHT